MNAEPLPLLTAAVLSRLTLLINHVLRGEPVASERLRPHAQRGIRLELRDWPRLLPALPALDFRVTPAGLIEWCGDDAAFEPDLLLSIDASNPAWLVARSMAGQRPAVEVQGDAALATDVSWLMDNLRWDVRDDLSRLLGPVQAQVLGRIASGIAGGLREALKFVSTLATRRRPGPGS